jgi:3-methyladenine DNA glycosylase AlkD
VPRRIPTNSDAVPKSRAALLEQLRQMRPRPRPGSAEALRSYLGSPLPVLGVRIPQLRGLVRSWAPGRSPPPLEEVHRIARWLWKGETFEERLLAIELLGRVRRELNEESWALADGWVEAASGWALSDALSMEALGWMVWSRPSRARRLRRWAISPSVWRRRSSLYALHRFVKGGQLELPLAQIDRLLQDPDPWVQRAAGTWLRESWKKDPGRVERFLRARVDRLPRIVITVATERTSRSFRAELRRLARASQGGSGRVSRSVPKRGGAAARRRAASARAQRRR